MFGAIPYEQRRHNQLMRRMTMGEATEGEIAIANDITSRIGGRKWERLPATLYHVTVALPYVLRDGLLTPYELTMKYGRSKFPTGLGGIDVDMHIALTDSKTDARNILDTLLLMRKVFRGEIYFSDLIGDMYSGRGAKKPWVWYMQRIKGMKFTQESLLYYGTRFQYDLSYRRDFFNDWLMGREWAGGPQDPVILGMRPERLANTQAGDIAIITCKSRPRTMGVKVGALGEWQIYTGKAVRLIGYEY